MSKIELKGHITGLDPVALRRAVDILRRVFTPDISTSPFYTRDKGRPGWIVFFSIYLDKVDPNAPQVIQLPLEKEA